MRDSDDPYDIAWLTRAGWEELEVCRAITVWMCHNYQDTWRTWHKSEKFWEEFWNWYYDGGYEIIHPTHQQTNIPASTNNEDIQPKTDEGRHSTIASTSTVMTRDRL